MSKGIALIAGLSIIAMFGVLAFIFPDRAAPIGAIFTAVVSLVGAYISLQVVNNGVRGKFFNTELMYKLENPETNNDGKK